MGASEDLHQANSSGGGLAVAALQVVIGVFTPLALISIGGVGIYAAPVLLPLLWITANASRGGGRWYFTVLAALLAAETAWAIAWSLAPALQLPLPVLAAAAMAVLFVKTWRRDFRAGTVIVTLVALGAFGLAGMGALAASGDTAKRQVNFERSDH